MDNSKNKLNSKKNGFVSQKKKKSFKCVFGKNYFCQLILLFSLFLLLFMDSTILFDTIHKSHCIISITFLILFTVLLAKKFQFQLNKLFLNKHK